MKLFETFLHFHRLSWIRADDDRRRAHTSDLTMARTMRYRDGPRLWPNNQRDTRVRVRFHCNKTYGRRRLQGPFRRTRAFVPPSRTPTTPGWCYSIAHPTAISAEPGHRRCPSSRRYESDACRRRGKKSRTRAEECSRRNFEIQAFGCARLLVRYVPEYPACPPSTTRRSRDEFVELNLVANFFETRQYGETFDRWLISDREDYRWRWYRRCAASVSIGFLLKYEHSLRLSVRVLRWEK